MFDDLRSWFLAYGWLMIAAAAAVAGLVGVTQSAFDALAKRRASRHADESKRRFSIIRIETLAFVVKWGLLVALLVFEAYLVLRMLEDFAPAFYKRHHLALQRAIPRVRNIAIIIIAFVAARRLSRIISESVLARISAQENKSATEALLRTKTLINVLQAVITTVLIIVAGLLILLEIDERAAPFAALAGIAGLAVAFASQSLLRDFFSGFFILLENQYRIGDSVRIGDKSGIVEAISLRLTKLRDETGALHIIPNGEIKTVTNASYNYSRALIDLSVPYAYKTQEVLDVLNRVNKELCADPDYAKTLLSSPRVLGIESLAPNAITYRVAINVKPHSQADISREYRKRAFEELKCAGIAVLPAPPAAPPA